LHLQQCFPSLFDREKHLFGCGDPNSDRIAYRACRNLVKKDISRIMNPLGVVAYHYKDRDYFQDIHD
jgi:hypothetical protein